MSITRKLAIVGPNLSGRLTLGRALAQRLLRDPTESIVTDAGAGRRFELRGMAADLEVQIAGLTGPSFFLDRSLAELLPDTDAVLLVLGTPTSDALGVEVARQQPQVADTIRAAQMSRKCWKDVPWTIIVNKCDLGAVAPGVFADFDELLPCFHVTANDDRTLGGLIDHVRSQIVVDAERTR